MSNVIPFPSREAAIDRAAEIIAKRWQIRFVVETGEFLVIDKTRRVARGQAIICPSEASVLRHVENALRDEAAR
jgi:hypothetical protein